MQQTEGEGPDVMLAILSNTPEHPKSYPLMAEKIKVHILTFCLLGLPCPQLAWAAQNSRPGWPPHTHPRRNPQRVAARSAASCVDGCVVAVQVENFVLPKPAVGTEGQASKISKFEP